MSSLASVPQGAFAALRASRAGAGLRRVPVSRTSPPVRCSPGDVSATAAAVSSPPEPQDGSHRLVYVGNLDFFTPPDDVRTGLLGLLGPLASSATAVEVPGWRDLQRPDGTPKPRKRRDEGKHNRGFAVVRFDTVDAGREAALVLDRAELEGRALRSSAGVQTKQMEAAAREADAEEDSDSDSEARRAAREARAERRAHNRRQKKRRKARQDAALEHTLDRLRRAHPLWDAADAEVPSLEVSGVEVPSLEVPGPVPGLPGRDVDDEPARAWWDDDAWRAGWGALYSRWRDDTAAVALGEMDWASCPPSADPSGAHRRGGAARGARKRRQVESFLAVLRAARLHDGAETRDRTKVRTVVDFGCGTGNLILPLAAANPSTRFVGLDLNPRSVALLRERADAAGLTNVRAEVGLIEDYEGPCDVALALHVCGDGTDAVLLQAQARGAAFVVAPCCVGKLKDGGLSSISGMKRELGADGDEPDSDSAGTVSTAETDDDASASDAMSGGLVVNPGPGRRRLTVIHPRSTWMRGRVQRPEYLSLAAAADWSGHQGVDATSAPGDLTRLPRAAKAAVELDRGAAAAEAGYGVRVMKMLHEGSGLKNDVIVGFPRAKIPLGCHVDGPAATWDLSV